MIIFYVEIISTPQHFYILTVGLDSQFAIIETVLTGVLDFAPKLRPKKTMIVGIVCTIGFICGLPLTCPVLLN